jgi:hypothetical protein
MSRESAETPSDTVRPSGNRKPPGRCPSKPVDDRLLWSA